MDFCINKLGFVANTDSGFVQVPKRGNIFLSSFCLEMASIWYGNYVYPKEGNQNWNTTLNLGAHNFLYWTKRLTKTY